MSDPEDEGTILIRNIGNQAAQNGIQEHTSMLQKLSDSY